MTFETKTEPNELSSNYLSVNGLNCFPGTVSSSRAQMFSSHISQRLVIAGQQQRYLLTGMEEEFAKYTFSVKMPCNGRVISVLERYPRKLGQNTIKENPQTLVIYENEDTKEVGIIDIPKYCSYHQYFGFEYEARAGLSKLTKNSVIPKDTIFVDSSSAGKNGEYKFGLQLNMAYMTHPAVSEDGILISEDVLHRHKFKTYERRVVEWGNKKFPLNLYGTPENYKAFPEIGDVIREDGLLMAFRTYDPLLAPVQQSIYDICQYEPMFDEAVYVAGAGGKIIDIIVTSDNGGSLNTPLGMDEQALKYSNTGREFYQQIVTEWKKLHKLRGDSLQITKDFHRLVTEAFGVIDDVSVTKLQKLYRMSPLDDFRVEFVIEYEITPTTGFKLTDVVGNFSH